MPARIQLNGQPYEVPAPLTVAQLLEQLDKIRSVAVEVNEEVVPRARHAETVLRDGDRVELVTLVGGG
jgi:sulfur carrier protein